MFEAALANLFAHLMGARIDFAGVPFFRINNARSRNAILSRLLKKKHGTSYNVYWNSLEKLIQQLDHDRNCIVHWAAETTITTDRPPPDQIVGYRLVPPNYMDRTEETPDITLEKLYDFILRCDFFERSVNILTFTISDHVPSESWKALCQLPVVYPPAENHPLAQI